MRRAPRILCAVSAAALTSASLGGIPAAAASTPTPVSSPPPVVSSTAPTPRAAKKPKIAVSNGAQLTVTIQPRVKGSAAYKFTLERLTTKKVKKKTKKVWRTVGSYVTAAGDGTKAISVESGSYRVTVKPKGGTSGATKTFNYVKQVATTRSGTYSSDYDWVYYFPVGYQPTGRLYPVIVAFSPGQVYDPPGPYDAQLRAVADRFGFIVMTSKYYRNPSPGPLDAQPPERYPDQDQVRMELEWDGIASYTCTQTDLAHYEVARQQMLRAFGQLPIDTSRVVMTGISGGGSYTHAMNLRYPGLAAAVVINTGMVWGMDVPSVGSGAPSVQNGPLWNKYMDLGCRTVADYVGSRKQAWFLESSNDGAGGKDFRYEEMLADAYRYRVMGWDVHEVDFVGGHTLAPTSVYDSVFAQLTSSPAWR